MKKILLLLLVMASFNVFSQDKKAVAIDLCVDTSFHDPNYEYISVKIKNYSNKRTQLFINQNCSSFSGYYLQPKICFKSGCININLSQSVFDTTSINCCTQNQTITFLHSDNTDYKDYIKTISVLLKRRESIEVNIRISKKQLSIADKIHICIGRYQEPDVYYISEVSNIQKTSSTPKYIPTKEKVKIELTEDKTKSNSTRVYLDFKITNISNKKIELLADEGYKLNPQMIFGVYDPIVSDTLHFNLFHPKFQKDDVILYNQQNDSISSSTNISSNKYPIKKGESLTIHLVMSRAEFNTIKCIQMKWYDTFAKRKNDEFEKRELYFPLGALGHK